MWIGIKNHGAEMNGSRLSKLSYSKRITFIDNTKTPHGITRKLMNSLNTNLYIESGSIGLKSVLVADGSADLFIKNVTVRDWDLAPAYVILSEVGGDLSLINGEKYNFTASMDKDEGFIVSRDLKLKKEILNAIESFKR